jgi:hypothetical protein
VPSPPRSLISATDSGRISSNFAEIRPTLVYVRKFELNSTSLEKFPPILALVPPKSVAEIQLRVFDHF